jgi:hypothetical protein
MRFRFRFRLVVVTTLASLTSISTFTSLATISTLASLARLTIWFRFRPVGFRCGLRVGIWPVWLRLRVWVWPIWLRELSASTANLFV